MEVGHRDVRHDLLTARSMCLALVGPAWFPDPERAMMPGRRATRRPAGVGTVHLPGPSGRGPGLAALGQVGEISSSRRPGRCSRSLCQAPIPVIGRRSRRRTAEGGLCGGLPLQAGRPLPASTPTAAPPGSAARSWPGRLCPGG